MSQPQELDPKASSWFRLFDRISRDSLLLTLVGICVIVTAGTHFRMNTLADDMADIKAGYEVNIRKMIESNSRLKKEVRLLQMKADRYEVKLDALKETIDVDQR